MREIYADRLDERETALETLVEYLEEQADQVRSALERAKQKYTIENGFIMIEEVFGSVEDSILAEWTDSKNNEYKLSVESFGVLDEEGSIEDIGAVYRIYPDNANLPGDKTFEKGQEQQVIEYLIQLGFWGLRLV